MTEITYAGNCHCGSIGYDYCTAIPPDEWSIRACQCAFCRAQDALSTSDPQGRFGIVNTHSPMPVPHTIAEVAPISYDGEDTSGRVSRREERWTPVNGVPW